MFDPKVIPTRKINVLLTGRPGIGKTTLFQNIIRNLTIEYCGFITIEKMQEGKRIGFETILSTGKTGILALKNPASPSPFRIGSYHIFIQEFENLVIPELIKGLNGEKLILIDEIGKMELMSKKFSNLLPDLLDTKRVLGTITKGSHPSLRNIESRIDTQIINLTTDNRKKVHTIISDYLGKRYGRKTFF